MRLVQTLVGALLCFSVALALAEDSEPETDKKGIGDKIGGGVSAINKVGGSILGKVTGVAAKVASLDGSKAPASVAVLPASGEGTLEEQNEVRIALHNSLGSTNIVSLKPSEVDRLLVVAETTKGVDWQSLPRQELANLMAVEGLIYVDIEKLERLYAGAYAHYEVGVNVSLYSAEKDDLVWEQAEKKAQRKGGVSLNPLGMLATAVSSARILTDAVRQVLINTIARKIADDIPQPKSLARAKKPIVIDMAVSNGVEGPFSVGDEIKVLVQAEPELVIFYDINGLKRQLPMEEKQPGEYLGSYVVGAGENAKNLFVTLNAKRVRDKQGLQWRVPGKITVDTIPPGEVVDFNATSLSDGVALSWNPPIGEDVADLSYHIERANVSNGVYEVLTDVAINEFVDTTAVAGDNYYYRIKTIDTAKNEGPSLAEKVTVFKPGPTTLSGLLEGDMTLPAVGNPFIIEGAVTIAANANVSFGAGTIVEFTPESSLTVQGKLNFLGDESGLISVRGNNWQLIFDGSNATAERAEYVSFSGLNADINLVGSRLALAHSKFDGVGIELLNGARFSLTNSQIQNADPGLRIVSGNAELRDSQFVGNVQAVVNLDPSPQQALTMQNVQFQSNDTALSVESNYALTGASFGALDLAEIQAQLAGPVTLNLSKLANGEALARDWLIPNLQNLQGFMAAEDWSAADEKIVAINRMMPSDGLAQLDAAVKSRIGGVVPAAYSGTAFSRSFAQSGRSLWLQNEAMPQLQAQSEELAARTVAKKFGKHYLKAQYPNKRGIEITKLSRAADFASAIDATLYLYSVDKGLLSEVWVAHIINDAVLGNMLAAAGLGSSSGSQLNYVVNISDSMAKNSILDLLSAQKVRYSLAANTGSPYRIVAEVVVAESTSQISQNLNMAEATLRLRIERAANNQVVGTWKAVGSGSAFSANDAKAKAVSLAVDKIQSLFMRKLWQLDAAGEPAVENTAKPQAAPPAPAPAPTTAV